MTDTTHDWGHAEPTGQARTDAAQTARPAEAKAFGAPTDPPTRAQLAQDVDALVRKSLDAARVQAEGLRRQSARWAADRRGEALETIDEHPLTVIAGAFGLGLILGAMIRR